MARSASLGAARALLLFGSHARGEATATSDVDVLVVVDGGEVRHSTRGRVSIFDYPWRVLVEGASSGDLFVCHVAFEAVALVDPEDLLLKLRATFRFKPDYADEIGRATDLGWFLVRHSDALDPSTVARRTVWCVRTILIARAAEEGKPVFSPDLLADRTASKAARHLLRHRHAGRADHAMRTRLGAFLRGHAPCDVFHHGADVEEFLRRFEATGNDTALRTASTLRKADQPYG